MEKYYLLSSLAMNPAIPERTWHENYFKPFPCGHRPPETALDVVLAYFGEDAPLSCVFEPFLATQKGSKEG